MRKVLSLFFVAAVSIALVFPSSSMACVGSKGGPCKKSKKPDVEKKAPANDDGTPKWTWKDLNPGPNPLGLGCFWGNGNNNNNNTVCD